MKNKNLIVYLTISAFVLIVLLLGYLIISNSKKEEYSCTDYETNQTYTFTSEEEMHKICDQFNGTEEDTIISQYDIYNALINTNNDSFSFYPYLEGNKKLAIIVTITDCDKPTQAKEQVSKWFENHSYNINDYQIDYEYPCDMQ